MSSPPIKTCVAMKTKMAAPMAKPHHVQQEFCSTRARYREGRELKAVKVYTVNQESRYLLVQGIPAVGAHDDLLKMFALYGAIEEYRILDEYPCDDFTEVMWIRFQKLPSARVAKRKMDNQSFYGGVLHVCYAPEYETVQDTREKLQDRRKTIAAKIRKLDMESGKTTTQRPSTSTMASSEEWSYKAQRTTKHRPPHTHSPQPGPSTQSAAPPPAPTRGWDQNNGEEPQKTTPNQPYYPPLPPPPQHPPPFTPRMEDSRRGELQAGHSNVHLGNEGGKQTNRDSYKGSPLEHHTQPSTNSKDAQDSNKGKTQPSQTVIKEFKTKSVPKFVPRQVRGRSKPSIPKHLLVKPTPPKDTVKAPEEDSVNQALKMESCVLRDVQGPRLPEKEEAKREAFRSSETGDESVDETVAAIRKRVHEFSTIAPPPQIKRKKKQ